MKVNESQSITLCQEPAASEFKRRRLIESRKLRSTTQRDGRARARGNKSQSITLCQEPPASASGSGGERRWQSIESSVRPRPLEETTDHRARARACRVMRFKALHCAKNHLLASARERAFDRKQKMAFDHSKRWPPCARGR